MSKLIKATIVTMFFAFVKRKLHTFYFQLAKYVTFEICLDIIYL